MRAQALANLDNHHLRRKRYVITHHDANNVIADDANCINFCSNDYLQLTQHPAIKKAFIAGVETYGLGSGASAVVAGYSKAHRQLEDACATFLNRERALLFNSGYHANLGVITTHANRKTTLIADKFCHASLIDGSVLSRAKLSRYTHNDTQHAEALLKKSAGKQTLLLTESVFSIQGDIADINTLAALATKYNSLLIVDDAHGVGVLGNQGGGIVDHLQLPQSAIPCLITPLGKAVGSMGAVVTGSHDLIETLLQFARTYRYSTALPPAICNATLAALAIIKNESWRRERLQQLIQFFNHEAMKRQLNLYSDDLTPIKTITIGANQVALTIQKKLMLSGFFVSCIRPPTVPIAAACIRISLNCAHTEIQIMNLLDQLQEHIEAHTNE